MKACVYVFLKSTVLDPQGQTICSALRSRGYGFVEDVRQGKSFDISISPETTREIAEQKLQEIAQEILANPVIEEFRVEILD